MSDQKTVPKGLRESEVECGNFKKPPISYIPVDDKIGEKVKSKAGTFKVKIDDKILVNASVWTGGNPKGFLIQVISAMGYIERSKLYKKWVSAKTKVDKYAADLQDTRNSVSDLLVRSKKLKKAQEKSNEPATAPTAKAAKKGMTDTPTVPDDPSEKDKIAEELAQLRESLVAILRIGNQPKRKRERLVIQFLHSTKICLTKPPSINGTKLSKSRSVSLRGPISMAKPTLQPVRKRSSLLKTV